MTSTDALITLLLFAGLSGFAGVACWLGEKRLQKRQQDWTAESGMKARR